MEESLKKKTVIGLLWSGVERFLGQIITFVIALVLARLVTPEDYGVLAIVMIFITLSGVMVDAGFANALVRKLNCTDIDRSTVFFFNIIVAIIIYVILYFIAPLLSNFYDKEELIILVRYASLIIIINSLGIVHQAILIQRIDFKKQTIISLASSLVSGAIGIYLAFMGYGVWALIVQAIILSFMRVVLLWIIVKWKPLLVFSINSFYDLFNYSYKLMLSNLFVQGGRNVIQLMLGKFFSISDLGYYNYAHQMGYFFPSNISVTIQRVLFPVFSQIQNDEKQLAINFRKSTVSSMIIVFPLMFGISVLAEPIIKLLLTDQWLPTIPLLRIIAVTLAIFPLLLFNMNILWVKKRSDLTLKLEIIAVSLRLICVLLLYRSGMFNMCIGFFLVEYLNFVIYAYVVGRECSYGLVAQFKDVLLLFIESLISSLFTYYLILPLINNSILKILFGFLSIIIIYLLLISIFRGYNYNIIVEYLKSLKNFIKND